MTLVNKKGVDIGDHNGDIDLAAVKRAGYDFVMIKCGIGSDLTDQDDSQFEANVRKAESLGMPWGAWLYSYALNTSQAQSELNHILRLLKGKRPTMPIALDVEDSDNYRKNHGGWNFSNVTACTKLVLEGLAAAGYYPMIYTGFEEIKNYIAESVYQKYDIWFAHWARSCGYKGGNLGIWQYGGETNLIDGNSIDGVGIVDKDICYKDYPAIIKSGGYNGGIECDDFQLKTRSREDISACCRPNYSGSADGESVAADVKAVQKWLNKTFDAALDVDGICGDQTKKALISGLQAVLNDWYKAGLEVDGVFGAKTKAAVRNLGKGAKGGYPSILQALLICKGYSSCGFDGIFGNGTESAVKTFQTVKGLRVDGIAGKATFEELTG